MKEVLDFGLQYKNELFRILSVFSITMAIVYTFGRMLNILKTDKAKNAVALVSVIGFNSAYSYFIKSMMTFGWIFFIWDITFFSSIVIILYVLLGFKLYSRVDSFLDAKLGKNKKK